MRKRTTAYPADSARTPTQLRFSGPGAQRPLADRWAPSGPARDRRAAAARPRRRACSAAGASRRAAGPRARAVNARPSRGCTLASWKSTSHRRPSRATITFDSLCRSSWHTPRAWRARERHAVDPRAQDLVAIVPAPRQRRHAFDARLRLERAPLAGEQTPRDPARERDATAARDATHERRSVGRDAVERVLLEHLADLHATRILRRLRGSSRS